jgi:nucleoside-diphosphate kinase
MQRWMRQEKTKPLIKKKANNMSLTQTIINSDSSERTLAIIKPDAVQNKHIGAIIDRIEKEGFDILGLKRIRLTQAMAEEFYAVHRGRPFYKNLVEFMMSGPVVVIALERKDAVAHWRAVMGATNPADAAPGTIRKLFGASIDNNAAHGSDSPVNGKNEVAFLFPELA